MKWQELMDTKKKQFIITLLPILLIALIFLLRACGGQRSDIPGADNDSAMQEGDIYIATVTYVITQPGSEHEPITFQLDAAPNGKAVIPPEMEDMESVVWSGWLTEDGSVFDFDTVLEQDITLYCSCWMDENNNNVADGTSMDPITIYQFRHANGSVLFSKSFFGHDVEFDYNVPEYAFPQSEDDGYIFLGWVEDRSATEDGGTVTVALTPNLASDRNNNDLIDGSAEDPYIYHIFLAQDGAVLEEIRWLAGDAEVKGDNIACPTTTKQKLVGWDRTESQNESGNTVYTYTPIIVE